MAIDIVQLAKKTGVIGGMPKSSGNVTPVASRKTISLKTDETSSAGAALRGFRALEQYTRPTGSLPSGPVMRGFRAVEQNSLANRLANRGMSIGDIGKSTPVLTNEKRNRLKEIETQIEALTAQREGYAASGQGAQAIALDKRIAELSQERENIFEAQGGSRNLQTQDNFLNRSLYGFERAGAGLLDMAESALKYVGSTANLLVGNKKGAESYYKNSLADKWQESIRQRYKPSTFDEKVTGFGSAVVNMLPAIAVSTVTANPAVATTAGKALIGLYSGGSAMKETISEGADIGEAGKYGNLRLALSVATESMFGGIPGLGKGVVSNAINNVVKVVQRVPGLSALLDIAGEGVEELVETELTPYLKRLTFDKDAPAATKQERLESFLLGSLAALALQAGIRLPASVETLFAGAGRTAPSQQQTTSPLAPQVQTSGKVNFPNANMPVNVSAEVNTPSNIAMADGTSKLTADVPKANYPVFDDSNVDFDNLPTPQNAVVMEREKQRPSVLQRAQRAYTRIVDTQTAIADRFSKAAGDRSGVLASNSRNAGGVVNYIFTDALVDRNGNVIGKSLKEVVSQIPRGQEQAFWTYMMHRNNIDRAAVGKPIFPDFSPAMSERYVSNTEAQNPSFKATGDEVISWLDTFEREWGVASGLIASDTYESLREMYKSYVPAQREFDEIEQSLPKDVARQFVDPRNPTMSATGSARDIHNPLENIMNLVNRRVKSAIYNSVGQEMVNSIRKDPDGLRQYAEIVNENTAKSSRADNIVTVLENGERVYLQINDKPLLEALKGLPKTTATFPVMSKGVQLFKTLITQKNPFFAVRNIFRDIPTAYQYGSTANPISFAAGLGGAAKDIVTNSPNYQRYKAVGAGMSGFFNVKDTSKVASELMMGGKPQNKIARIFKAIPNAVEAFNNFTESVPRLAEFNRVYEKTGDVQQAAHAANNVTVNFARGGDVAKAMDRNFVPYLNAGIQGLDKLVRNFSPRTVAVALAKGGIMITLPTVLLAWVNRDDEDYDALSNHIKDNYFCIPIGGGHGDGEVGNGKFLKIPKSRELGVIFSALPERIIRWASGDEEAFKDFGATAATSFAPTNPIENNILSPLLNLKSNKNYYGANIVPQYMISDKRSKYLQYDERTSEITKLIAEYAHEAGVDISPKMMDYLVDAYTGVIADFLLPATTAGADVLESLGTQFIADPTYSNQNVVDFYDNYEEVQRIAADQKITGNVPSGTMTLEKKLESAMSVASGKISELSKASLKAGIGALSDDDKKVLEYYGIDPSLETKKLQEALRKERIKIATEVNAMYARKDEMEIDIYRSGSIANKVEVYKSLGLSEEKAYSLYNTLDALDSPKINDKLDAVIEQNYDAKTEAAILGYLASGDSSILTKLKDHTKLATLYAETGDTSVINMRTPETIVHKGETHNLTKPEMAKYTSNYLKAFNSGISGVWDSPDPVKALASLKEYANDYAKRMYFGESYESEWDKTYEAVTTQGIALSTYLAYKDALDSGMKKVEVMAVIDGLDLTGAQKDYLYYSKGYAESTIREAPWH